jgi:CDP-4-dehydro-6-deoxyglucose reductase
LRRSYSVANAGTVLQQIELHVRQVHVGEMSHYWFDQAKPNDLLRLNGPLGTFVLRDTVGLDLLLLATGTGIAPIKAMVEGLVTAPAARLPRSVTVYWGGRTAPDLYWDPATLAIHHRFVPVLSRADAGWTGARGHVQQAVLATIPDLGNAAVYACGSYAMIQSARTELVAAGLPKNRFHSDAFVSSSAA